MRSNRPQYCMVCRLRLVSQFTGCKNGWLMCHPELSEELSVVVCGSKILFCIKKLLITKRYCSLSILSVEMSESQQQKQKPKWECSNRETDCIYCSSFHPLDSIQQTHLLMQLCILTKGWSPNTELSRFPASGHFKGFSL